MEMKMNKPSLEERLEEILDTHFEDYMWPSPTGDVSAFELAKEAILEAVKEEGCKFCGHNRPPSPDNPYKGKSIIEDFNKGIGDKDA
jgi:hypothetical protein